MTSSPADEGGSGPVAVCPPAGVAGVAALRALASWAERERALLLIGFSAALLLVMREASALLAQLQSRGARSYGMHSLTGARLNAWNVDPLADAFRRWTQDQELAHEAARWVSVHAVCDMFFTASYCLVLYLLLRRGFASSRRIWATRLALAVFVADELENIATLGFGVAVACASRPPSVLLHVLAGLTAAKWAALAVAIVVAVGQNALRIIDHHGLAAARVGCGDGRRPLASQALQVASRAKLVNNELGRARVLSRLRVQIGALVVMAAFVVLPGGGPLEQLSDVLRGLFDGSAWDVLASAAPTVLALALFSSALYVSGRWALLPGRVPNEERSGPLRPLALLVAGVAAAAAAAVAYTWQRCPWATGGMYALPAVCAALGLLPWLAGGRVRGDGWPAAAAEPASDGLAAAPGTASVTPRCVGPERPQPDPVAVIDVPEGDGRQRLVRAIRVVAALPVMFASLGLVRAFAAPVLLRNTWPSTAGWLAGAAATAGAVAGAPAAAAALRLVDRGLEHGPGPVPSRPRTAVECAMTGTVLGALLGVAVRPIEVGGWWQLNGVLVLFLSGVVLTLGWLRQRTETRRPPFWVWRLRLGRRSPVFAMAALVFVLAGELDITGGYHDARLLPAAAAVKPTPDLSLAGAWGSWTEQMRTAAMCRGRPVAVSGARGADRRSVPSVPLVLVAAAGGGIRAAYWTVGVLDGLAGPGAGPFTPGHAGCARRSVFALSGVSGGSVGIATWLSEADSKRAISGLSSPRPLAAVGSAMLLRDLPRAFTGINFGFDDRAGVLERAWEKAAPGLAQPLSSVTGPGDDWRPVVMMNSTSVETGCRLLVTRLDAAVARTPNDDCRSARTAAQPDLFAAGATDAADYLVDRARLDHGKCQADPAYGSLALSTAAHLSARFTYVSPSGGLAGCPPDRDEPSAPTVVAAIDGGYLENGGLQSLVQLWDALSPKVAAWNTDPDSPFAVVPLLVFAENHYQSSADEPAPRRRLETLVPLKGKNAPQTAMSGPVWEQQAAQRFAGAPPGLDLACPPDGTELLCRRSFRIAPDVEPQVAAPLGWALSAGSRQNLDTQLKDQFGTATGRDDGPLRGGDYLTAMSRLVNGGVPSG